jgi:hypothetical protein
MLKLKSTYYLFRDHYNIIRKEFKSKFPLPFFRRAQLFLRGFLSEKYVLYNFKNNNYREYLSDIQSARARWINNPYTEVLSNKFIFDKVVGQFIKVPKTYALVTKGVTTFVNKEVEGQVDFENIFQVIASTPVILKPVTGGGGAGIIQIENINGEIYKDGEVISEEGLLIAITKLDNYMITERLVQGKFAASLNEKTINCMRIVTIFDEESQKVFIVRAVQRIGVEKSSPFDNFTRGGISAEIDLDSGVLSSATSHPTLSEAVWHDVHPDTGATVKGRIMDDWSDVKKDVLFAANKMPYLKCIGWDILLTDSGVYAIEGNHHPDPDVLQCHGGILKDERVKRFYTCHGIGA